MIPRLFIIDDEAPARARLTTLLSDIAVEYPHELVGEADSAQCALDRIAVSKPDIVLLDVQMPGMTGMELALHLMQFGPDAPAIIFVTAYDAYALRAFEVHALDYLLKPVRARRLADALRRACALSIHASAQTIAATATTLQSTRQHFSTQERGRLLLVPVADVLYLRAEQKYVTVRTRTQEYLIEESLTAIEQEFSTIFIRIHRNALVARSAIVGAERGMHAIDVEGESDKVQESWQVILRDVEERLPVSRRQWGGVKGIVR